MTWRLRRPDGMYDFGAIGMFVRLIGPPEATTEGISSPARQPEQPYEAEVAVPRGGTAHVEFGIAGYAGAERSDRLFPMVDVIYRANEIRPANPQAPPPPSQIDGLPQYLALLVATIVLAFVLAVRLGARYRMRSAPQGDGLDPLRQ